MLVKVSNGLFWCLFAVCASDLYAQQRLCVYQGFAGWPPNFEICEEIGAGQKPLPLVLAGGFQEAGKGPCGALVHAESWAAAATFGSVAAGASGLVLGGGLGKGDCVDPAGARYIGSFRLRALNPPAPPGECLTLFFPLGAPSGLQRVEIL